MPSDSILSSVLHTDGEIVVFQPDEQLKIEVRLGQESVWLNQQQMADLFGVNRQAITKHLKNIYDTQELQSEATRSILELVQKEGARLVKREVAFYNLDVIISVGYRVNTQRGIQFRQWASSILKDYMLRGYAINQRLMAMEERIDRKLLLHDQLLTEHQKKIDFFVKRNIPPVEQVFFNGDFFEARILLERLIKTAQHRVIVIDGYVDAATLELLDSRGEGVSAVIYTKTDRSALNDLHVQAGYRSVKTLVWKTPSHDRWLIVDDSVYHCGHSLKDMGRKMCAVTLMGIGAEEILNAIQ